MSTRLPAAYFPTLIEEESGLLTLFPVDEEAAAVLAHRDLRLTEIIPSIKVPVHEFKPGLERRCARAFVIHSLEIFSQNIFESFANP